MGWQDRENTRKEGRVKLLFDPLLLDKEGKLIARVADLSMSGALLYTRRGAYGAGQTVAGWLQSPPQDDGEEFFLAATFIVKWVSEDDLGGWSRLGCELKPLDEASAGKLRQLIALSAP